MFFDETTVSEAVTSAVESATSTTTGVAQTITGVDWQAILQKVAEWCVTTGIKLIISIIVMIICFKIINFVTKRITKRLEKRKADATLSRVLVNVIRVALKVFILICIIGFLGVETSSIAAVITSAGVGIGLALQGTLSNFAGGIIIVLMRPFKLDDFITAQGEMGTVEDIKLFYTTLRTVDNRVVYIPNGSLANGVIVNNSVKETRRVDIVMSVSYDTNIELAKNLLLKCMNNNELILKDQPLFAEVTEFAASSIDITTRCWVKNADLWTVKFDLMKEYKNAFDEHHIEIPFNQLDVNIANK